MGSPALVKPINKGMEEQEQNGVDKEEETVRMQEQTSNVETYRVKHVDD